MIIPFQSMTMTKFNICCMPKYTDILDLVEIDVQQAFGIDLNECMEDMKARMNVLKKLRMRYYEDLIYVMYLGSFYEENDRFDVVITATNNDFDNELTLDVAVIEHNKISYFVPLFLYNEQNAEIFATETLIQHIYQTNTVVTNTDYDNFEILITAQQITITHYQTDVMDYVPLLAYDFNTATLLQVFKPKAMSDKDVRIVNSLLISMFNQKRYIMTQNENEEYELLLI